MAARLPGSPADVGGLRRIRSGDLIWSPGSVKETRSGLHGARHLLSSPAGTGFNPQVSGEGGRQTLLTATCLVEYDALWGGMPLKRPASSRPPIRGADTRPRANLVPRIPGIAARHRGQNAPATVSIGRGIRARFRKPDPVVTPSLPRQRVSRQRCHEPHQHRLDLCLLVRGQKRQNFGFVFLGPCDQRRDTLPPFGTQPDPDPAAVQ